MAEVAAPQATPTAQGPFDTRQTCEHASDRLLVQFSPTLAASARARAATAAGASNGRGIGLVPGLQVVKVTQPAAAQGISGPQTPEQALMAAAARLVRAPGVVAVEPDCTVRLDATPDDPSFGQQWALANTGQSGGTPGADIGATTGWNTRTSATAVTVAIVDSGIDTTHPDLAANLWTNPGEIAGNLIDDDGNGYVDDIHGWDFVHGTPLAGDDNGHGTHVAGTIGAVGNNGIGVTGVAWTASLMGLKAFDSTGNASITNILLALDYAQANGASVVNASFGSATFLRLEYLAYEALGNAGVLTVAAAGNEAKDADEAPHFPASFDLPGIISVTASTRTDTLASFANYGVWTVDVAAPGEAIYSTKPGSTYGNLSGTSMATPHVTGVAAVVKAQHPAWTGLQVRDRILGTTRKVSALTGLAWTGGVVSLANALSGAATVLPPPPSPGPAPLDGTVVADPAPAPVAAPEAPVFADPEVIDESLPDTFGPPAITVAADGTPYVAWARRADGIHLSSRTGDTWTDNSVTSAYDDMYWVDVATKADSTPVTVLMRNWSSLGAYWDPGIISVTGSGTPAETRLTAACPDADTCLQDWTPKVAVDADGYQHVVFTRTAPWLQDDVVAPSGSAPDVPGTGLYYATNWSGAWVVTRLTTGSNDGPASIALSPDGLVHIVVPRKAGAATGLHHISNESGHWVDTQLTSNTADSRPSVAVGTDGTVHVSFTRAPLGVDYMTRTGFTWSTPAVVHGGDAMDQELALDPLGRPGIALGITDELQTAAGIIYTQLRADAWQETPVAGGQAMMPSLAYGPDGAAHVAWYQGTFGDGVGIRYATNGTGSWVSSDIGPGTAVIRPEQLASASDAAGHDHVVATMHWGRPDVGLYYGTNATGSWVLTKLATWADSANLAVDPDGTPHVVFMEVLDPATNTFLTGPARRAVYATLAGDTWSLTSLATGYDVGPARPAIAVGPAGPMVIFADSSQTVLHFGRLTDGGWVLSPVPGTDLMREADAVQDADGVLHLVLGENRAGASWPQARYLTYDAGTWTSSNATADGAWHENPRITLAADGVTPWITDWDPTGGAVSVTHPSGDSWVSTVVSSGISNQVPDIVTDDAGVVHVVYTKAAFYHEYGCAVPMCEGSAGLYEAAFDGTDWTTTRLSPYWSDINPSLGRGGDGTVDIMFIRNQRGLRRLPLVYPGPNAHLKRAWPYAQSGDVTFTVDFTGAVTDFTASDMTVSGSATGCVVGDPTGGPTSWTVPVTGCSEGTVILHLQAGSVTGGDLKTGPGAAVSSLSILVDTTKPAISVPSVVVADGQPLAGSSVRFGLAWTASDGGSGPGSVELQRTTNGGLSWTPVSILADATSSTVAVAASGTTRFRVRETDRAGNVSDWKATIPLAPRLVQQSAASVRWAGAWTGVSSPAFSGGSARYTRAAGASASWTISAARGVAFVTSIGPGRGRVRIYLDGVAVKTLDLYRVTATHRVVVWSRLFGSAGTHTVKVVALGTAGRPRVDVDAFAVLR